MKRYNSGSMVKIFLDLLQKKKINKKIKKTKKKKKQKKKRKTRVFLVQM